jgi:hypothetical protein
MASNSPLIGSVVTLPANMNGEVEGWYANIWQINISPSGQNHSMTITGSAPGLCALSGTLTQEGNLNVFDVSITYTGSCPPGPIPRTGVGFESNSDYFQLNGGAAGTYFYFASTTYGNVLELFP